MSLRGLNTLVLLCAATICAESLAITKQPEGWANVNIVAATSDVVVCAIHVSTAQDELFALDTLGKKVLWRKKGYAVTRGETDGRGNFLVVEPAEKLLSRKLKNGEVNWQSPFPPPRDNEPNSSRHICCKYRGPFVRGQKAFVFRQGRKAPSADVLFNDWLVFDTADGRLLQHGDSYPLGLAGDLLVVEKDHGSIAAITGSDFREYPIYRKHAPHASAAHPFDAWPRGGPQIQYSHEGRCVFRIADSPGPLYRATIYDSSGRKLTILEPAEDPSLPVDWILLSDYAIRYSAAGRIAVYDSVGKRARQYELPPPTDADNDNLLFAGTSGNGSLIFRRRERLLVFDVPSLELTAQVKRKANAPWGRIFIKRASDIIYSVEGNTVFENMPAEQVTRKIIVNLTSLKSGQTLWAHTKEVTIKKQQTASPP